jgi:hypothetical protein
MQGREEDCAAAWGLLKVVFFFLQQAYLYQQQRAAMIDIEFKFTDIRAFITG